jgi:hypothetical protein
MKTSNKSAKQFAALSLSEMNQINGGTKYITVIIDGVKYRIPTN